MFTSLLFSLVLITGSGDEYVVDYNISLDDCMHRLVAEVKEAEVHEQWVCQPTSMDALNVPR